MGENDMKLNVDKLVDEFESYYKKAFIKLLLEYEDNICSICKHDYRKICNEKCPYRVEGQGATDEKNNYYNWKWTCLDFDFTDCDGLKDTRCANCVKDKFSEDGFELDESKVDEYLKSLGKNL